MEKSKSLAGETLKKSIFLFIVILSILQIFFENFCIFCSLPLKICEMINLSTIFFDLFFSIVFFCKLIHNIVKKHFIQYFFYNNGFIDFLVSIPMLFLVSIPTLLIYLRVHDIIHNDNFFMYLSKIFYASLCVKSYKFIRMLNFVNCLDLPISKMAKRHFQKIMQSVFFTIIFSLCLYSLGKDSGVVPSKFVEAEKNEASIMYSIIKQHEILDSDFAPIICSYVEAFPNIYGIIYDQKWIYQSREAQDTTISAKVIYYENMYNYRTAFNDKLFVFFSHKVFYQNLALNYILFLIGMFIFIILIIFLYVPFFELNIATPIKQMLKSMSKKWNVNKIEIEKNYENDEIYLLAKEFNKRWIPAKIKTLMAKEPGYQFDGIKFQQINKNVLQEPNKESQ